MLQSLIDSLPSVEQVEKVLGIIYRILVLIAEFGEVAIAIDNGTYYTETETETKSVKA